MKRIYFLLLTGLLIALPALPGRAQQNNNEVRIPAPALPEGLQWFNSKPLTMAGLRGRVVLIDFWEYTCVNCIRTMPYLREWHEKYADKGLVIIGVHTPEFDFARAAENITRAAKEFKLTYPLINDRDHAVWNTYGNRFWPAKYLIDKDGMVRYYHFGEGAYGQTEAAIQKLLKERDPKVALPAIGEAKRGTDKPGAVCYPVTPELYLGYERGGFAGTLGNREGYTPNQVRTFKDPGSWLDGKVYAHGQWENHREALISARKSDTASDYIAIQYHALEVNSVIKPERGQPIVVYVTHDGKPVAQHDKGDDIQYDAEGRSFIKVIEPRMYNLIKNREFGQRKLKLSTADPGLGIYTFTFVSCEVAGRPRKNIIQ